MSTSSSEELVKKAVSGNKLAAQSLVHLIQDKTYGLCLKMLWQTEEAQEACQEIMLKVFTHLSQFNFKSKFETWVYRIAVNHLIDKRRSLAANNSITFSSFEQDILTDQTEPSEQEENSPEFQLQLKEIRLSCTTALLQCLDEDHRLAYIFGEIFEFDHRESSEILNISSALFRKRLERSRKNVEGFTTRVCGVISSENATCKCSKKIQYAKACNRVDFTNFSLATSSKENQDTVNYIGKIELAKRTATHYRMTRDFISPVDFSKILDLLIK